MITHSSGAIRSTRQGNPPVIHTFPINFSDPTAVVKGIGTFAASLQQPIAMKVKLLIETASNATTHALQVAIQGGSTLMATANLKSAAGTTIDADAGVDKYTILSADTTLYAIPTITGTPTVGKAYLMVETWEINVNEPSVV